MKKITIYSDGAARGNPGKAGAGAVLISESGKVLSEIAKYLGDDITNNQAEYTALILALEEAFDLKAKNIMVYADSELMVRQINGDYKVKNEGIKPLFQKVKALLKKFDAYEVEHIPREKNKHADRLSNVAIDEMR